MGSEYLYFHGAKASKEYDLWKMVYSDDIFNLALKNNSLNTICLVHVVDHFDKVEEAFQEVARVLKKGGKVYFSCISEYHFESNPLISLFKCFNRENANLYIEYLALKRTNFNYLSENEWKKILEDCGFVIEEFHFFLDGVFAYFRYFLHFTFFINRCFDFDFLKKEPFERFSKKLFYFFYISIGYPAYLRVKRGEPKWGTDIFVSAKKTK